MKHLFKRLFVFLMMSTLCLPSAYIVHAAKIDNPLPSEMYVDDGKMVSIVKETIKLFYENKDLGYKNNLSKVISQPLLSLLDDKANTHQYVTELYETNKENYDVKVSVLENIKVGQNVHLKLQVITTFNYYNLPDVKTEVSENVYVLYDFDKALICDLYTYDNYYDMAVRNLDLNTSVKSNISQPFSLDSDIESRQAKLRYDIDEVFDSQSSYKIEKSDNNLVLRTSMLDTNAIVTYARNNYNKTSPASGNGTVTYYDFSQISGNYDCTNFVSHSLLAGGANVYDTGGSGISSTGWYYRNLSNRSSSWSGVNQLYNYLVNNTVSNYPRGIALVYSHNTGAWSIGHVLQFGNSSSSYDHSTIVTVKGYSNDGARAYAYVTGRTSATQYNNNQAADDMFPSGFKRTIYVYNY